jgi:hypothetical protein
MLRPFPALALATLCVLPAACGEAEQAPREAQRISLEEARGVPGAPLLSPDTRDAAWTANGQAIDFGVAGEPPLLTLACALRESPVQLQVIRHAPARPGQKALFPVIGNGTISRFKVDAVLHEGEWRWEGALPAGDPMFEVFTGPRGIEATLPGGGTVAMAGSRIPGEFVEWCRAGGRVQRAVAEEEAGAGDE